MLGRLCTRKKLRLVKAETPLGLTLCVRMMSYDEYLAGGLLCLAWFLNYFPSSRPFVSLPSFKG